MTILRSLSRCSPRRSAALLASAMLLAACSPSLNWRQMRPEGAPLLTLFPCKPSGPTRSVTLAGAPAAVTVLSCDAQGMTFGLTFADVGDPARVGPALQALATVVAGNVGATAPSAPASAAVPGATPNPGAGRLRLEGRRPDGGAIQVQLVLFAHGTQVFQATVLGSRLDQEAVDTFLDALQVGG